MPREATQLVGAEPERPYERPPLSKQYLLDRAGRDSAFVHDAGWYADQDVELRTGVRATRLDPAAHRLTLHTGEEIAYARLPLQVPLVRAALRAAGR